MEHQPISPSSRTRNRSAGKGAFSRTALVQSRSNRNCFSLHRVVRCAVIVLACVLGFSCNDEPTKPSNDKPTEGPVAIASTWSPDGKRIAYLRAGYSKANLRSEVRILNLETGEEVIVDSSGIHVGHMDWSPDGEWLVMEIDYDIYKLHIASDSLVRLTHGGGARFYPNWNHDGTLIVYDVFDGLETLGLYTITPDGTEDRPLHIDARWGDWLGTTDSIVAHLWTSENCGIIAIAVDSTPPVHWSNCKSPILSRIGGIVASSDARYVAFEEALVVDSTISGRQIHILARSDSVSMPVSPAYCEYPSWSPDNRHLAYSSLIDGALHVYDVVTGQARRITDVIRP